MTLDQFKRVYFIGIGGIGMSALARYFNAIGLSVAGYDRTSSALTDTLSAEGMPIHYEDDLHLVPAIFKDDNQSTLVVYTPAVPSDLKELNYFISHRFNVLKRAEVLGLITRSKLAIAIAGTHGKTTTTTLTAHLLTQSTVGCNAFLGGISKNYETNLLLEPNSEYVVVEADEYDRSFLRLFPQLAVITSTDADHLDIYGSKEEIHKSFIAFAKQINEGGILVYKKGIEVSFDEVNHIKKYTYSLVTGADFYPENIRVEQGKQFFDLISPKGRIDDLVLGLPGLMNVENAIAASALALLSGVKPDELRRALSSFKGVARRFDFQIKTDRLVYIDDYAHHPVEIKAAVTSAKRLYPGKKIIGIFQPHLYSRTRDFAPEFAQSLSLLDELILLDIYPARELPIPGITSKLIFDSVTCPEKTLCSAEDIIGLLKNKKIEIIMTMGAGSIDRLVAPIKAELNNRL